MMGANRYAQYLADVNLLLFEINYIIIERLCKSNKLIRKIRKISNQGLIFHL